MHCCQSSALKWMSLHLVAFHWFGFAWSCLFASARVMRVARRLPFSSTLQCISLQAKALPSGTMGDLVKLRIWEQQARATPHHPPYLLPFMSPPGLPQYRTEKKELNLSWWPNPRMTQGSPRLIRIPTPPICYFVAKSGFMQIILFLCVNVCKCVRLSLSYTVVIVV